MRARATVVHVITQLELGGAQEIAMLFCRHLATRGFDVHLVAGKGGLLDEEAMRLPGVSFHYDDSLARELRPVRDVASWGSLRALFRRLRSDSGLPMIVHTHSSKAGIVGRWAAYAAGAELRVHSIHGFAFHSFQPWWERGLYRALERVTARITHAFCPVSEANKQKAIDSGLFGPEQTVVVLPVAIEPEQYVPDPADRRRVRDELAVGEDETLIGMIACLKPQKAPLDFVRLASRVRAVAPRTRFFVAGDGELRPQMEAEISRLALDGTLLLLGWRRDVRALLGALDVLVLTSLWEGLPRTVLEAMVAAKPVVATRVDGTPEAVEDGSNGLLAEPHDVDALAERVARLALDPDLARRMGERGRERVAEFSAPRILGKLDALYDDLLGRLS
jgi:glycosyltransferase involved in cell wall biosynthesis